MGKKDGSYSKKTDIDNQNLDMQKDTYLMDGLVPILKMTAEMQEDSSEILNVVDGDKDDRSQNTSDPKSNSKTHILIGLLCTLGFITLAITLGVLFLRKKKTRHVYSKKNWTWLWMPLTTSSYMQQYQETPDQSPLPPLGRKSRVQITFVTLIKPHKCR